MVKAPQNNPLVTAAQDRNSIIPLDKIKAEHFMPALDWAMDLARERIEKIKAEPNPTFNSIVEKMETAGTELDLVSSVFSNFSSLVSTDEIKKLEQPFYQKLTEFGNDISLDAQLFKQVKAVYDARQIYNLRPNQEKLLEDEYKGFVQSGALLDDAGKQRLRDMSTRLSELSIQFRQNVQEDEESFECWVDDVADLKGLPDSNISTAKEAAEEAGQPDKYLFKLDAPQVMAVLSYAENRDLRETLWRAYSGRGRDAKRDNQPIILEAITLRHEKAQLLGYKHHADYILENRMAGEVDAVTKMLDQMHEVSFETAKEEHQELTDFAKSEGFKDVLKPWDMSFYVEKLQKATYGFDDQDLKPYLEFERCKQGVFNIAERLYDVSFKKSDTLPTYHKDADVYEVFDNKTGEKLAILYNDFFPRKGKRSGAWMNVYRSQGVDENGNRIPPVLGIHGNFPKATKTTPALLTHDDVQTLIHEFGHGLHGILSDVEYPSQAGPNVEWDAVELPSQVMENWVNEKEGLDTFAEHYKKPGQKIPDDLMEKMQAAQKFRAASFTLRQTRLAALDMGWHTTHPGTIEGVEEFEREVTRVFDIYDPEGALTSPAFSHIFAGGYSAGYYSYEWARVLDADAFEAFKENGLFDKETANKFRKLLEAGGSKKAADLYREFRGRDADPKAALKRLGLEIKTPKRPKKKQPPRKFG